MKSKVTSTLSVEKYRAYPDHVFVFGDNLIRAGMAGQACIRKEPNSFGIPTKRYPSTTEHSYFSDAPCEREHVLRALRELYKIGKHRTIVFPMKGIGTGLAKMPEKSPLIFAEMNDILLKHFEYRMKP
jgi:hypothetical protein